MKKYKGWKVEKQIDDFLHKCDKPFDIVGMFKEAKTLISRLRKVIKEQNKDNQDL